MWTKKDSLIMASAALATFGITVAAFWPRTLNAGGQGAPVTRTIAQPKLEIGTVSIAATLDPVAPHRVILTAINAGTDPASANFKAAAMVTAPASAMSRSGPRSTQVWTQDYVLNLNAGETKQVTVDLPDVAFLPPNATSQDITVYTPPNQQPTPFNRMTPGSGYLTLSPAATSDTNAPFPSTMIRSVTLWQGKVIPTDKPPADQPKPVQAKADGPAQPAKGTP